MCAVPTFILSHAYYTSNNTNAAEEATHFFFLIRSSLKEALAHLSYQGHGEVPTLFPCWKDEIHHIRQAPVPKTVAITDDGTSIVICALHLGQKGAVGIEDVT